jgi:leucyl aminopeptidase
MKLSFQKSTVKRIASDIVAVFLFEDPELLKEEAKTLTRAISSVKTLFDAGDFRGKEDEIALVYDKSLASKRLMIIGLGVSKKLTLEKLRRAAARAARKAKSLKVSTIAMRFPDLAFVGGSIGESVENIAQSMAEGATLGLYKYDKYITVKEDKGETPKIEEVVFFYESGEEAYQLRKGIKIAKAICDAAYFARDLANAPGVEIYPETLAAAAMETAKKHGFKGKVLGMKEIQDMKMGGLLAVSKGSARPPRFITLEYGPAGTNADTVVLVGKGVTFDSGGISIKPAANMGEMKMDMSGGAAVLGTIQAAADLRLPIHLVGLIPAAENMPSGSASLPGDIITIMNGKTVEVDNTDAEGRLILADALAYAERYKPKLVIDLATLTGACVVALGHFATGMLGTDEGQMARLKKAGDKTHERVWQLPLFEEYDKLIKSDVADVKNTGGKWAGAISAAAFLRKFIGDYPWIHLDIAGTAMLEEPTDYEPKGGSGVGVRLLVEFLRNWGSA